ncbi:hypothetical protein C2G38_2190265 [Gigaspora rosea]|uniref:Uncharacterized protein n=1 Tax=Gigaspora rosea TaxID=44941 RepID=A0A397V1C8_9GLOM|nr:hypothetical protein C2G38_2190265 [Gigaspora rosea]
MRVFRIKRKIKPRGSVSISSKQINTEGDCGVSFEGGSFRFHKGTWSFVRSPGTWLRTEVTEEMQINSQEATSRQLFPPMAGSFHIENNKENERPPTAGCEKNENNDKDSNDEDSDYDLGDDQKLIRNVFLKLLDESKENEADKTLKESLLLNDIVDLTKIKTQRYFEKESLKKKRQSLDFCKQFIAESCNRVEVPNLVRKSCVNGCFDPFVHEGHDIAQDIMKHIMEAPINLDTKSDDLERTYAIDTATDNKEIEDQVKLGTNAKKLLNKLLEEVPYNKFKVWRNSNSFYDEAIAFSTNVLSAIQELNRDHSKAVYNILVDAIKNT